MLSKIFVTKACIHICFDEIYTKKTYKNEKTCFIRTSVTDKTFYARNCVVTQEKYTAGTILHDRWSWRSRQISTLHCILSLKRKKLCHIYPFMNATFYFLIWLRFMPIDISSQPQNTIYTAFHVSFLIWLSFFMNWYFFTISEWTEKQLYTFLGANLISTLNLYLYQSMIEISIKSLLFSKLWFCQKRAPKNFSGQNNSQQQKYTTYENACDTSYISNFIC